MPQCSRRSTSLLLRHAAVLGTLLAAAVPAFPAASLQPTRAGLVRQSLGARDAGFSYLDNDQQVHDFVRQGLLVTLRGNADYYIHEDVRHTAARPEVKLFIERLAKQYRAGCGERLVVTSLVRPRNRQPWNSDPLSVHPTGMAVDLRISSTSACRRWLESTLLDLEGKGLVEAARERVVPHYHVVIFPSYAERLEQKGIELPAAGGMMLASTAGIGAMGAQSIAMALHGMSPAAAAALPVAIPPLAVTAVAHTTAPAVQRTTAHRPTATARKATPTRRATVAKRPTTRRYKVRSGDSLWTIARRHGITVQAIRRVNRVPSRLKPGQVLAIPAR